ncbi:MAG: gamma carbonic anhydrase family protein [Candidatus Omnitrophica bacterium]|nr:gamma carbonic anhydrase family protein [Candidatus Omnitrophota bacterium]MBI4367757.1 gamma carbonic anhydrase family protein [Candidatus Omnitrophota bacterium]
MITLPQKPFQPKIGKDVFIHSSAVVIGQVTLGDHVNIWPGVVLRADINRIVIGKCSNIQDLSVAHVETNRGCFVGEYCVVGHSVILHSCRVGDGVLIGMGAVILDDAKIGDRALIGAGSLVTEGMKVKPESLYFGRPAKFVRKLSKKEIHDTVKWAEKYARIAEAHQKGLYLPAYSS